MESKKLRFDFHLNFSTKLIFVSLFIYSLLSTTFYGQDYRTECGVRQATVNYDGFVYEIWQSKNNSDGCMVIKNNSDFYASWSNIQNTLVRKSKRPGTDNQRINYYIDTDISGNSFYSAYGWWRDTSQSNEYRQIVEYYVVEGYGVHKPVDGLDYKGNYTVSGEGTYELWIGDNRYDPTVYGAGNKRFTQIKAVRTSKRSSGNISMAKHFSEWADEGFSVKNLFEVSMKVEGYSNGPSDPTSGGAYVRADFSTSGSFNGGGNNSGGSNNNGGSGTISGTFRLKARSGGRYATSNNENWATVRETKFENWSSQHWTFEHVSGNTYRLKEQYGNRYLSGNNNSGAVEVANLNTSWNSQQWILEKTGSRYRLKCRWGNKYLSSPNSNWGALTLKSGSSGNSKQFTLESVGKSAITDDISQQNTAESFNIYPIPAGDVINVDFTGTLGNEASITIYNIQGRIISEQPYLEKLTSINTRQLSPGTYIMSIVTEKEKLIKRFSKK